MARDAILTVCIPTWNRRPLCEIAIDSIGRQIGDLPVRILVSDHGSTDGTFQMLKEKQKLYPLDTFVCRRLEKPDFSHNFKFAFDLPESPFTWTFGDDDKMLDGALEKIIKILDERVPFVHVAEASRTRNTMQVVQGTMIENCNKLGFLDFTGFITANIIRTDKLKAAINSKNWDKYAETAFPQSLSLLESLFFDQTAFIDHALIEAQDRDLSGPLRTEDDRGQRWANAGIGARYSYIIDHLKLALEANNYKQPLEKSFFRYLSAYLWDRFACDTINTYTGHIMAGIKEPFPHEQLWDFFAEIGQYLDKNDRDWLANEMELGKSILTDHQASIWALDAQGIRLDEFSKARTTEQFPYTYLGEIGDH